MRRSWETFRFRSEFKQLRKLAFRSNPTMILRFVGISSLNHIFSTMAILSRTYYFWSSIGYFLTQWPHSWPLCISSLKETPHQEFSEKIFVFVYHSKFLLSLYYILHILFLLYNLEFFLYLKNLIIILFSWFFLPEILLRQKFF